MAALSTAAVTAITTGGATVAFNAATIDCNACQLKQLAKMFDVLAQSSGNSESGNAAVAITGLPVSV